MPARQDLDEGLLTAIAEKTGGFYSRADDVDALRNIVKKIDQLEKTTNIAELLQPGTLVQMGAMTFSTGGAVSNVGIAMKIFGCSVAFVAKVGGDTIGRIIIEILEKNGSAEGITMADEEASSYTVVVSPPDSGAVVLEDWEAVTLSPPPARQAGIGEPDLVARCPPPRSESSGVR